MIVERHELHYSFVSGCCDITPKSPTALAGYGNSAVFQSIADPLEVNALIFGVDGDRFLLLSTDLLYHSDEVLKSLESTLDGLISFSILAASHTHGAPATSNRLSKLGPVSPGYVAFVTQQIHDLVHDLLKQEEIPTVIRYEESPVHAGYNRRLKVFHLERKFPVPKLSYGIRSRPNLAGFSDNVLRTLSFRDPMSGELLGVVWGLSCHPVAKPVRGQVSADFPGYVRKAIREKLGMPELPVLFFQGLSGNVRPFKILEQDGSIMGRLRAALMGPAYRKHFDLDEFESWSGSLVGVLLGCLNQDESKVLQGSSVTASCSCLPLSELIEGITHEQELVINRLQIGRDLSFVTFSAEVAVEYLHLLRDVFPGQVIFPVSWVGRVFGYLPTDKIVREGGYEGLRFFEYFGLEGPFKRGIERRIQRVLKELV